MHLISLILTLGGVSLVTVQTVIGMDVGGIARDIREVPVSSSEKIPAYFAAADNALQFGESEQNIMNNMLSTSPGPVEFFTASDAYREAERELKLGRELANVTGQQPGIGLVRNKRQRSSCVYDTANNKACTSSAFREPTARCTSLNTKTWAMAGTPYTRLITPKYQDGVGSRRVTGIASGQLLRSPREISVTVTSTRVVLDQEITSHLMQWGQFIAHDISHIADVDPKASCCPEKIAQQRFGRNGRPFELQQIRQDLIRFRNDVCQQIELANDPVHRKDICMNHIRSKPAPHHGCAIGLRQQMNAVTHLVDASAVYGSSQAEQVALRDLSNGKMKVQQSNGATLPPQDTGPTCPSNKRAQNRCPFLGGDARINATPNLISTHTAFVNKHNQIVNELARINPLWGHGKLFQESRRIVTAIQANIHFYEWLPVVVNNNVLNRHKLTSYDGFDASVDPSMLNELAGAAMRFGHSTINGIFSLVNDNGNTVRANLRPSFFDSDVIYNGGTKQCVRGMSRDPIWSVDKFFPTQMRDHLFNQILDIVSMNINRGRDHGFGSYVDYRKHFGLSVPNSFNDLTRTHPSDVINSLRRVYANVGDVELYIGGVTERKMAGGLVGELFANILARGFSRSRKGDRLFFESPHSGLTAAQISAIRKYKYAQLLCEGNGMDRTLSKAFIRQGRRGSVEVACSSFTPLNLNLWKSGGGGGGGGGKPKVCPWRVSGRSQCCHGSQVVHRVCVKSPSCQCEGGHTWFHKTESCQCMDWMCHWCFNWG